MASEEKILEYVKEHLEFVRDCNQYVPEEDLDDSDWYKSGFNDGQIALCKDLIKLIEEDT